MKTFTIRPHHPDAREVFNGTGWFRKSRAEDAAQDIANQTRQPVDLIERQDAGVAEQTQVATTIQPETGT